MRDVKPITIVVSEHHKSGVIVSMSFHIFSESFKTAVNDGHISLWGIVLVFHTRGANFYVLTQLFQNALVDKNVRGDLHKILG